MWGSVRAEPKLCRPQRAWFRFFSMRRVASIASLVLLHSSRDASACLGRACGPALILHFQVMPWAVVLLLGQFVKKVAHTLQSHIIEVEIEALREVSVGGLQVHVDQAVEGSLHLGGIILINLEFMVDR